MTTTSQTQWKRVIAAVILCFLFQRLIRWSFHVTTTFIPQEFIDSTTSSLTSHSSDIVQFFIASGSESFSKNENEPLIDATNTIRQARPSIDNNNNNNVISPKQQLTETSCFSLNSKAWLEGPRRGNIAVPDEWLDTMMQPHRYLDEPNLFNLLDQTLCSATGRFRNFAPPSWMNNNTTDNNNNNHDNNDNDNNDNPLSHNIHDWEFRLLYLAIHRKFHIEAYREYQLRKNCGKNMEQQGRRTLPYSVGNYDFECPNAKFLVTTINTRAGMGTVMRQGVMPSFFMAFASGRIPLFVQAVNNGTTSTTTTTTTIMMEGLHDMLTRPFPLASCDRGDWQCVFLPTSPCVLTLDELRHATILDGSAKKYLRRTGNVPEALGGETTRVLVQDASDLMSLHLNSVIQEKIRQQAILAVTDLLNDCRNNNDVEKSNASLLSYQRWNILEAAVALLNVSYSSREDIVKRSSYRKIRYLRIAFFYMTRPNSWARKEIAKQFGDTIPTQKNGNQDRHYFGLPIRGTDKCSYESTCLSFDRYMELMLIKWRELGGSPRKRGTILLTSEDPTIPSLQLAYAQNNNNHSFPLDFVINQADVRQGHGKPRQYLSRADAIMISSLTAIKIQLEANVLVLNCCSNFHFLMNVLAEEGCGADPHADITCLNRRRRRMDDDEDSRFRICCKSEKRGGVCAQIWANNTKKKKKRESQRKSINNNKETIATLQRVPSMARMNDDR